MKKLKGILFLTVMIGILLIGLTTISIAADDELKTYGNLSYKEYEDSISIYRLLNRTEVTEIEIPEKINGKVVDTIVGNFAMPAQGEVVALKKITIPSTVESIGTDYYGTFTNAENLEEIIVDSNNAYFCSVDGVLYSKDKTTLVEYPANRKGNMYNVPNSVNTIKTRAFAFAKNLDVVNIPDSVTKIKEGAFAQSSIKSLTISKFVEKVESDLCYKCPNLTTVNINSSGIIELNSFEGCKNLTTVTIGDNCTAGIRSWAFKDCTKLKNINLDTCKAVGINSEAFANCTSLPKTIKLSNSFKVISKKAFDSDVKLELSGTDYVEMTDEWDKCINIKVDGTQDYTYAYEVFNLTNQERKKENLTELKLDEKLMDIAMQRAYEISVYFAHRRPEVYRGFALGSPDADTKVFIDDTTYRIGLYGIVTFSGENIAAGATSPEQVMNTWMNSSGHKANILHESFTTMGVGSIKTDAGYFWVQIFGRDTSTYKPEQTRSNKREMRIVPVSLSYVGNVQRNPGITLYHNKSSVYVGDTTNVRVRSNFLYTGAVTYLSPSSFIWTSSNNRILTVDQNGNVKGIAPGSANVTITMSDGTTRSINMTVKEKTIPLSYISLNKTYITLDKGKSETLLVTYNPTNTTASKEITWRSSNSSVVTVDENGKVTAKGNGTATITAIASNGTSTTCDVVVQTRQNIAYATHVQRVGWQDYVQNGTMSGTSGQGLRLEGIKIYVENQEYDGNIEYATHVQQIGWQDYVKNGAMSGTSGKGLRLEAIKIRLTGTMATKYDVYYRVHCQQLGWMGWAKNGEASGSAGFGYRLEGIQIVLVRKGGAAPGSTQNAFKQNKNSVMYTTHVQRIGWQDYVRNGTMSGTSGQGLRLEGIKIYLENKEYDGNIEYTTHVQQIGWQDYVKNGAMSGTSGKGLRLEAIKIRLTGTMATKYDVYYRVHCQQLGWMGWAKNGEASGSAGFGYRLEGIEIVLVEKGKAAPGNTANHFKSI